MMKRIGIACLLAAAFATPDAHGAQGGKRKVVVIVNASNPVESLRADQVRELFLKKTTTWKSVLPGDLKGFDDNERVRPVDLADHVAERKAFLEQVLEMSSSALQRHWVRLQYQAALDAPPQAESSERAVRLVGDTRGGIGFAAEDSLTEELRKKVKVVLTLAAP
jgi:ABC-type phosphate transport system substrate-binding protein